MLLSIVGLIIGNGLFTGLLKRNIKSLQVTQDAAARLLTSTKVTYHVTPVLRSLHWLPGTQGIDFKAMLLFL